MRERFHARDDRSSMLRFHTQTAGSTLTAQQPENNIIRVTIQALAAILGGTQSLHTNSMDEALALPSEKAALVALRTQQVLAHESAVTATADPLGGSFYVESLTARIIEKAQTYLDEIDRMGGAMAAVENGYFQIEIQKSAYEYQKDIESKERVVVGVNDYLSESAQPLAVLKVDPLLERKQIEFLNSVRRGRNQKEVSSRLARLEDASKNDRNVLPAVVDCVESLVTVGEICDTLRKVWGEYKENVTI
jgi:methylmalonyl-CoA mutase N-terminal domain/subunit